MARPDVRAWLLVGPATLFIFLLFVAPLGEMLWRSVGGADFTLKHYETFFSTPLYIRVLGHTFWTAFVVTLICLLLGYPVAFVIARYGGKLGGLLLLVVAMSMWTSFLVRAYAWMVILGNRGPVVALLNALGDPNPKVLFTTFAATIGLVHLLLPYMVMAIYAVMARIDPAHLRAAASLGATPGSAFRHVYLPLSLPGVVNGCVLVFIICLGFYVTPVLLGGPQDHLIAGLIGEQIEELLNWGLAAAMSMVLLVATLGVLAIYNAVVGLDKLWG